MSFWYSVPPYTTEYVLHKYVLLSFDLIQCDNTIRCNVVKKKYTFTILVTSIEKVKQNLRHQVRQPGFVFLLALLYQLSR